MATRKTSDGSVVDSYGRILYFSFDRFMSEIVQGNRCFICGVSPDVARFNDEHALPDWILRRYELHSRKMHLPNATLCEYRHFKIPCCEDCNSLMGDTFEKPIREMFSSGYAAFTQELGKRGLAFLFNWLALIFFKMHLKDRNIRLERDLRQQDLRIGEAYSWEELHHIHCISRAFYSGALIDPSAAGSILVLPAKVRKHLESFDFLDLHLPQIILLRIDEVAVLAVMNDCCAGLTVWEDRIRTVAGPLSPLQLREIAAMLAFANVKLSPRPRFFSEFLDENYRICGTKPTAISLPPFSNDEYGKLLYHLSKDFLLPYASQEVVDQVKGGKWTFLTTSDGKFARDNMELVSTDDKRLV
ncbi:MAG: hypothetical protein ACHP8B_09185 [Terriglobales bacterium]